MPFNLSDKEKKLWRDAHPRHFQGSYGSYYDNFFCGLRCGYNYSVRELRKVK